MTQARKRNADHADHHWRRQAHDGVLEGVMGTGIAFPTVQEGKGRIRTIMTATHTQEQMNQALETLKRMGKRMGILQ